MSTISASTTSTTAYKVTADTTGTLVLQTGASPTTAVTIDTSQNVGIGTSSPTQRFHALAAAANNTVAKFESGTGSTTMYLQFSSNGQSAADSGYIGYDSSKNMTFYNANAEKMRIDSSGNLLVGTTDSSSSSGVGVKITNLASTPTLTTVCSQSTSALTTYQLYSTGAAAFRFYVGAQGQVYATNTTISAISDQRFKENIRDLDVGLDKIMALKPRLYDWKEGKGADIKNARGFIAQEFEQVFPDLIDEWADPAPEGEEPYKSVRQDLIPVLVKAIQELNAKVDAQAAEIAALKGAA